MASIEIVRVLLAAAAAVGGIAIVLGGIALSLRCRKISTSTGREWLAKAVTLTAAFLALLFVVGVLSYW